MDNFDETKMQGVDVQYSNDDTDFDMKIRFSEKVDELLKQKAHNSGILSWEKYCLIIAEVKLAKIKPKKESIDYRRLKTYDVIEDDGIEKLIVPFSDSNSFLLYYVHTEELFDILQETHIRIGHGGRNRMERELQTRYKNITRELITMFLQLCKHCQNKLSKQKKSLISKPFSYKEFYSRGQVDIIDMQSNPDGDYKFILYYLDPLTKFVLLRPLKSERAEDVAHQLLDIFTTIGAPSILQSSNGRDFVHKIIIELKCMWSDLKLVHGKPVESLNQDSVECGSEDIENKMSAWMETNKSSHWAESLQFIQFTKNTAVHQDNPISPFEVMFGYKAKIGLSTSNLPKEILDNLVTEEDLETAEKDLEYDFNGKYFSRNETFASAQEQLELKNSNPLLDKLKCKAGKKKCGSCQGCVKDAETICKIKYEADESYKEKITCMLNSYQEEVSKKRAAFQQSLQTQKAKIPKNSETPSSSSRK